MSDLRALCDDDDDCDCECHDAFLNDWSATRDEMDRLSSWDRATEQLRHLLTPLEIEAWARELDLAEATRREAAEGAPAMPHLRFAEMIHRRAAFLRVLLGTLGAVD